MEDIIKNCVESRKNAILGIINSNDQTAMETINAYFKKLEDFASTCSSITDFEEKFQTSGFQEEYTNLFTKFMNTGNNEETSLASDVKDEILDDVYHRGRREIRQEAYDKVRDIPVVGDALNVKQHIDFFSRFKHKKDD